MNLTAQIAKQFRGVYFGGNWTAVNLQNTLKDVSWEQATTKIYTFNTIATLVYHTNYYVCAVLNVLEGNALDAHDKYSFDLPPVQTQRDWEKLLEKTWADAERLAGLVEQMPENKLLENFSDGKYGNNYRNITGIIEHNHYHLGQMVLIKKILQQTEKSDNG